ncbi:hypothetical protein CNE_BB1p07130 (plasmid) [Cupriavidus necator N-1]|uniref:DUF1508 domain-containing protein n=1 Tax=Cupriavidus necator (strain ATCC 43291 / DSM 13513 / CCUG 52238 / LMG 8453 / N-1) TaxID=1042878 RepID=F8GXR0_CUPNN|nr:hypothetical protein [Cupriavidus necator]AEI82130.1 hypothetical protein CNE_BB1p07130 [Cupriavidus necator N-1]MDX6008425.1 hypothetical protein [Cupriavidus necator]
MEDSFFYKNHDVVMELSERTFGHWHWSYTLDGQGTFESQCDAFGTRELAMVDAKSNAQARIDRASS